MNKSHKKLPALIALAASLVALGWSSAQEARAVETRINTTTSNDQQSPNVATDAAGNSVIVWQSNLQDGSANGIYARRYGANGAPIGGEFRVNTVTARDQSEPSVALSASGSFLVAWTNARPGNSGSNISAQLYNSSGLAQGGEITVGSTTNNDRNQPSVASDGAGNFIVAYTVDRLDGSGSGIYARRVSSSGVLEGKGTFVNSTTQGSQSQPSVAMDSAGNSAIAWTSSDQDGSGDGIYAQLYDSSGTPFGNEFRVNTTTLNHQSNPSVSIGSSGNFVIAWQSLAQDNSGIGIYAQRYSGGVPAGGEFLVSSSVANNQSNPSAAMDSAGNSVISWESSLKDGTNGDVYARRYNSSGLAVGGEFRINSYTTSDQGHPNVALDGAGRFIIAWTSAGQDSSGLGVYADRFDFNIAPTTKNSSEFILEDTPITFNLSARDEERSPLTYIIVTLPTHGTLSGDASTRTYTPDANYNGSDSFTFKVNDGLADSNISKVSFAIQAVNDAPVAKNQFVALNEDASTQITLNSRDADGNALAYTLVSQPTKGTLSGTGANMIYTPNANANGSDSFTFKTNDGKLDSNVAKISLAISAVNDAPVAQAQNVSANAGSSIYITLTATDVDNAALTYSTGSAAHGTLTLSGNIRKYTPAAGYTGPDSFTFQANDGSLSSNTATVSITVTN